MALGFMIVHAVTAQAGWQYTAVKYGEGMPGMPAGQDTVKAWVDGAKARVEMAEGGNPMMKAGTYLLTTDGGKNITLVNPRERTYSKMDMEALLGGAAGMMKMMQGMITFADHKVDTLLKEAGPPIAGLPTRHIRLRTSYTMVVAMFGQNQKSRIVTDEDIWVCEKLTDAGLTLWMGNQDIKTGNADLDRLIEAEKAKVKGFPLKRITVTTTIDGSGRKTVSKMTLEITDIKKTKPAASLFAMPQGYRKTSIFPTGGRGGAGHGADKSLSDLMKQFQQ